MRPSFVQIAIVILIIVIIFGAPKLPQLARSLGQSMKIFKSEVKEMRNDDEHQEQAAIQQAPQAQPQQPYQPQQQYQQPYQPQPGQNNPGQPQQ